MLVYSLAAKFSSHSYDMILSLRVFPFNVLLEQQENLIENNYVQNSFSAYDIRLENSAFRGRPEEGNKGDSPVSCR